MESSCCWNMYVLPLLLVAACLPPVRLIEGAPLDDYVAQADPHYSYTIQKKEDRTDVTVYTLNMTSQKWLDETEVDRPIWWHQLFIYVPKNLTLNQSCLLILSFGNNNDPHATGTDYNPDDAINVASSTGSCVALLKQIPNQPITFHNIPVQQCKNSDEGYVVACSWWMFLNNKTAKPHTLAFFPMVKAAVRGMDTITDCLWKESGGKTNITTFAVAGMSKRGWTTWLTAAVDVRAPAFFPVVFDRLNLIQHLKRQYRSYCGWSYVLKPWYDMNVTRQLDTPRFKELASLIDPLSFNERYADKSMYISIATGDEFGMPDDSYLYFKELKGAKYFQIVPNADHVYNFSPLQRMILLPNLKAFYVSTMKNLSVPHISWTRTEDNTTGAIVLHTDWVPSSVKCFHAHTNPLWNRRDFRLTVAYLVLNPVLWGQCNVTEEFVCEHYKCNMQFFPQTAHSVAVGITLWTMAKGVYKVEMKKPSGGWIGFFIQATFSIPSIKDKYMLTSEIQILNDTYPCPECYGEQCYGKLV